MRKSLVRRLLAATALLAALAISVAAQQGPPPGGGPGGRPGGGPGGPGGRPGGGPGMFGPPLQISSPGFADGTPVPDKYTCAAGMQNMTSPEVKWVNPPAGTQSFVLLVHDPEGHPGKTTYDVTHWIIFNIPADATGLPEGVKADSTLGVQGANIARQPSYFGPCAPPGPNHHYTWELFALDTKLDLQKGASRDEVMKAMDGHVLGGAELIGLFHRQPGAGMGGPPPGRPPQQ